MSELISIITPDWPAPARVRAACTTRIGGASRGPYASLNLAGHVGDAEAHVAENRARLAAALELPNEPGWLSQVHGTEVVRLPCVDRHPVADASYVAEAGAVCAILTADCLPVLFCDDEGRTVAAAHAGWRGLAGGVLEATVRALPSAPSALMAWLGPAIGPAVFEVGAEVHSRFIAHDPDASVCFTPGPAPGKFFADLYALARRRLQSAGVRRVYGGGRCTYSERANFFSFRRDGVCGRMAALIWLSG